mgnify:CR=1 FL=1
MRSIRLSAALAATSATVLLAASPAGACGGLVGENGTIQLTRTSTLAAYHDGVERYVTSFEFTGTGESVGSIIPLPGIPDEVVRGGDWTLQRLAQEVAPPAPDSALALSDAASGESATVILETQIDALDITVSTVTRAYSEAKRIGLTNSTFRNATGLFNPRSDTHGQEEV